MAWQFDVLPSQWQLSSRQAVTNRAIEMPPTPQKPFVVPSAKQTTQNQASPQPNMPSSPEFSSQAFNAPQQYQQPVPQKQVLTSANHPASPQTAQAPAVLPQSSEEMQQLNALWSSQPTAETNRSPIIQTAMVEAPIQQSSHNQVTTAHFASRSTPDLPQQNTEPEATYQQLPYQAESKPHSVQTLPYRAESNPPTQLIRTADLQSAAQPEEGAIQQASAQKIVNASLSKPAVNPNELTTNQEVMRLRLLSTDYWKQPEAVNKDELQLLAERIYFDHSRHYLSACKVQPGEMLSTIAARYQVTWQYLAKLNNITPDQLQSGMELKVIQGPFSAVVDVSDMKLIVHNRGYFVAEFPIGLGTTMQTPLGKLMVTDKQENPDYDGPNGLIDRDDWSNPLGEHLVKLNESFGLHSTPLPETIGQYSGEGGVRLKPEHMTQLYHLLTTQSDVTIRQ